MDKFLQTINLTDYLTSIVLDFFKPAFIWALVLGFSFWLLLIGINFGYNLLFDVDKGI